MDATPPPAIHCEAPAQDVLLRVVGEPGDPNWPAFLADIRHLEGNWAIVSSRDANGARELVLRAYPAVSYKAVTDAVFNARARSFDTQVTFGTPRCAGTA